MSEPTGTDDDRVVWERLDWRTVLVRPFAQLGQLVPALIGVIVLGRSLSTVWIGIVFAVLVLSGGVFTYLTTRYRVTDAQVQLRTGLVTRSRLAAPRDRVRTVDVTAPLVHRLLGVVRVEIGTGTAGNSSELTLDAVSRADLDGLREALLHRAAPGPAVQGPAVQGPALPDEASDPSAPTPPVAVPDDVLLRWDPRWTVYAPLTTAGLAAIAAVIGLGFQFGDDLGVADRVESVGSELSSASPTWFVLIGGVLILAVSAVTAVALNVLGWFGLELRRDHSGGLHVSRGLLTTRAVAVEQARLRGVTMSEPLGVRLAGGAALQTVISGLAVEGGTTDSAALTPPAPRGVVVGLAGEIVGAEFAATRLVAHPPPARRRRLVRALVPVVVLVGAGIVLGAAGLLAWWLIATASVLLAAAAVALGLDRYASLGHAVGEELVVVRQGSLLRRTTALRRTGVIGVTVRASVFQRRAGLSTVAVTTAAGVGAYEMLDVGAAQGLEVAQAAVPGLLDPFLTGRPDRQGSVPHAEQRAEVGRP